MHRTTLLRTILLGCALLTIATSDHVLEHMAGAAEDASPVESERPLSIEAAKDRARVMHTIYAATLDAMHHHYFHANKSVLPARALEDVFADVARDTKSTARWIAVNTKAMSVDHEPATEFERKAAAELSTGKAEFTTVENGYFRRAGGIQLGAGCVSCHTGAFSKPPTTPRYVGLVVSIPVRED